MDLHAQVQIRSTAMEKALDGAEAKVAGLVQERGRVCSSAGHGVPQHHRCSRDQSYQQEQTVLPAAHYGRTQLPNVCTRR